MGDGLRRVSADDFAFARDASQDAVSARYRPSGYCLPRGMATGQLAGEQCLAFPYLVGDIDDLWSDGHPARHLRYDGGDQGREGKDGVMLLYVNVVRELPISKCE